MRLGKKKEKDRDTEKEQIIEGVARLICSPKQSHPTPMRGKIFRFCCKQFLGIRIFVHSFWLVESAVQYKLTGGALGLWA